jgi:hypothetical protein
MEHFEGWPQLVAYAVSLLAAVVAYTWKLSQVKAAMDRRVDDARALVIEKETKLRQDTVDALDAATRSIGEGLAAVRQKATDVEIWVRDNFVRSRDFQNSLESINRSIDALRTEVTAGYLRLDAKLDRVLREDKDSR